MRYEVVYRCTFDYEGPVAESQNELRAVPLTDDRQTLLHARVGTVPSARVLTTTDYWGTRVDSFGVRGPHDRLEVLVEATVESSPPPRVEAVVDRSTLDGVAFRDAQRELLQDSPMAAPGERVRALADELSTAATDVVGLARVACTTVAGRVARDTDATVVGTPVDEVLDAGTGACQDRARLLVAVLRALGVPARYVSGYVTDRSTCDHATTHAWVEIAVPGEGWHTLDPCNDDDPVDERIVIGRGRDYGDVSPLRGTYVGGEARELTVSVAVTPVVPVG